MRNIHVLLLIVTYLFTTSLYAQSLSAEFYQIGTPTVQQYYVDPVAGNDSNPGTSLTRPKKTVSSIWNAIPQNTLLTTGYTINLLPGAYGSDELPNYWEERKGSAQAPIILQAYNGFGTVFFTRDINMAGVEYFYLLGVDIKNDTGDGYGDAFHCERCSHILLRGNSFNGAPSGLSSGRDIAHETLKFNQSSGIYIENNNIQGADDNAIDWVAVNYGHIRGNRIHSTQGWCVYAKGGSSYVLIESNVVYDCGEGGVTAGQGTGLEFMVSPWTRFEANYVKIVNNLIYNVTGAGLGVNGGYQVLLAHNTLYRVGTRSHLIEVVFGERSCDGDTSTCASLQAAGAWGPTVTGSDAVQPIGNRNIKIYNNVIYNPSGVSSGSQHFAIYGPRTPTAAGIPSPQVTDSGLSIKGNVIWNGSNSMPVGVEESDQGCQSSNTTCTLSQLQSDNAINTFEPQFVQHAAYDLRPASGSALAQYSSVAIPDFEALDSTLTPIYEGDRGASLTREFSGATTAARPPGAFANASSLNDLPSSGNETPDSGSVANQAPSLTKITISAMAKRGKITVQHTISATDDSGVSSVSALIKSGNKTVGSLILRASGARFTGKKVITSRAKKLSVTITAQDSEGLTVSKTKKVTVK